MSNTKYPIPSDEEEEQINAGIAADPDAQEWTDDMFSRAKRARGTETLWQAKQLLTHSDSSTTQRYYRRKPELIRTAKK